MITVVFYSGARLDQIYRPNDVFVNIYRGKLQGPFNNLAIRSWNLYSNLARFKREIPEGMCDTSVFFTFAQRQVIKGLTYDTGLHVFDIVFTCLSVPGHYTVEEWQQEADGFRAQWNFPNCLVLWMGNMSSFAPHQKLDQHSTTTIIHLPLC